ncbi:response regulator transcription factor [Paenibacillus woosongensis]|uniref:Helix-turn-helix domain-containing protein n=1 Tax=Paenibacillus woosongensis TaxID=307580 RepID=A0A7X2Z0E5_9BACL|nr:helix-turn-helix domain-containing protein [Paenibacillus woosongensis]MUG45332.1 helix-turn-helix domain-containing protein [Paenibacillus woosongensis]
MYRLLVVDDEMIIADGLYEVLSNLPQLELDVYKAYSGDEAVRLFDRTRFDIVLTDIRMPGLNGLELLDKIRERWPSCRVIFLTGHNEFSYIYSAFQYEGVSYLLKTEGYEKVIQMVEQAAMDIETELKAEALLQKAQEQLDATRELLQKDYVKGILNEQLGVQEIHQKQFDELAIPLRADRPVLIMLGRVNSFASALTYATKSRQLYRIRLIANQYLSARVSFVDVVNESMDPVWLIQPLQESSEAESWERAMTFMKGNLELIQSACRESLGEVLSFVLDDSPVMWKDAAERFSTVNMLMNYRIGQGCGMLLLAKQMIEKQLQPPGEEQRGKPLLRHAKPAVLADQLEHGQRAEFRAILLDCAAALAGIDSMHHVPAQELYYSIGLVFLSYMNRWNLVETAATRIGLHKLMQPGEHESWQQAFDYLLHVGDMLFSLQSQEEERRARDVITVIQKHVQDHLHDPDEISLVRLAELVFFNPSYLSRLFKQVTGTNLSEYISACRMTRAKRLLENPDVKIQDVAELVGYGTATNFTRSFRKATHMTPQEYRATIFNR